MELELESERLGASGWHSSPVPVRRCFPSGKVTCPGSHGWTRQEGTHRRDSKLQPRFGLWLSGVLQSPWSSPRLPTALQSVWKAPLASCLPHPSPHQLSFPRKETPVEVLGWALSCSVFCLAFRPSALTLLQMFLGPSCSVGRGGLTCPRLLIFG